MSQARVLVLEWVRRDSFAVNGLRSRANNFTVDGSDNNDEDIGVRRQGFVALIPATNRIDAGVSA